MLILSVNKKYKGGFMKTLEAFQKAAEGKVVRNIKTGHEIECDSADHLKGKNKYFDFNFMNLNDHWEVVEKKILYNIRVYDSTRTLIESYNSNIEKSKIKDYVDKVFEFYFGSRYKNLEPKYIYGENCPYMRPIAFENGNVVAEPIKTNKN
jgi:hypothetical protein